MHDIQVLSVEPCCKVLVRLNLQSCCLLEVSVNTFSVQVLQTFIHRTYKRAVTALIIHGLSREQGISWFLLATLLCRLRLLLNFCQPKASLKFVRICHNLHNIKIILKALKIQLELLLKKLCQILSDHVCQWVYFRRDIKKNPLYANEVLFFFNLLIYRMQTTRWKF